MEAPPKVKPCFADPCACGVPGELVKGRSRSRHRMHLQILYYCRAAVGVSSGRSCRINLGNFHPYMSYQYQHQLSSEPACSRAIESPDDADASFEGFGYLQAK